jgi:hypothetical protein
LDQQDDKHASAVLSASQEAPAAFAPTITKRSPRRRVQVAQHVRSLDALPDKEAFEPKTDNPFYEWPKDNDNPNGKAKGRMTGCYRKPYEKEKGGENFHLFFPPFGLAANPSSTNRRTASARPGKSG